MTRESFGLEPDLLLWREHGRVLTRRGSLLAGLCLLPLDQFFGGRAVRSSGMAWVSVIPEERGRGWGRMLLHFALEELRERGVRLCCLYPSGLGFYRNAGFAVAGARTRHKCDIEKLVVEGSSSEDVKKVAGAVVETLKKNGG
jgi:predicted acetyltransferase